MLDLNIDFEHMKDRQKSIALWSFLLFMLLFLHMVLDPILHWSDV